MSIIPFWEEEDEFKDEFIEEEDEIFNCIEDRWEYIFVYDTPSYMGMVLDDEVEMGWVYGFNHDFTGVVISNKVKNYTRIALMPLEFVYQTFIIPFLMAGSYRWRKSGKFRNNPIVKIFSKLFYYQYFNLLNLRIWSFINYLYEFELNRYVPIERIGSQPEFYLFTKKKLEAGKMIPYYIAFDKANDSESIYFKIMDGLTFMEVQLSIYSHIFEVVLDGFEKMKMDFEAELESMGIDLKGGEE